MARSQSRHDSPVTVMTRLFECLGQMAIESRASSRRSFAVQEVTISPSLLAYLRHDAHPFLATNRRGLSDGHRCSAPRIVPFRELRTFSGAPVGVGRQHLKAPLIAFGYQLLDLRKRRHRPSAAVLLHKPL